LEPVNCDRAHTNQSTINDTLHDTKYDTTLRMILPTLITRDAHFVTFASKEQRERSAIA